MSSHYQMWTLHSYCSSDYESFVQKFRGIILYAYNLIVSEYDSKARDRSLSKLYREENMANLCLQLSNDKVVPWGNYEVMGRKNVQISNICTNLESFSQIIIS